MNEFSPNLSTNEDHVLNTNLQFQDFSDFPVSNKYSNEDGAPASSIWSLKYYVKYFDVTTEQVVSRIKWSMIPQSQVNYYDHYIKPQPDLYGPIWICVTLIFTVAVSGNMANYLQTAASAEYHWKYDFHAVTLAAIAIFLYAWVFPLCLWTSLKWTHATVVEVPLLDLTCLYGYCLSIYVPVSILWVIQISWLQWFLVLIGALLSGAVLFTSLYPLISSKNIAIIIVIVLCHFLLAVGFMIYFFHVPT